MKAFGRTVVVRRSAAAGRTGIVPAGVLVCAMACLGLDRPVRADTGAEQVKVIELFTSQGCPKCPPADKLIGELAKEPDTIALSYAVNYWDYTGWKDTLASPIFTARQRAYAAARGDHDIYTPQVIVDGVKAEPGADRDAISRDASALARPAGGVITMTEKAGKITVVITPTEAYRHEPASIFVLRIAREKTIKISRGDNSGRELKYTNVVRAMDRLGEWDGHRRSFDVLDLKGDDDGYIVILQAGSATKPGPILAAAKSPGL